MAMASPVCKIAIACSMTRQDTRFVVERALWLARNGRPGPVWIDVPIDVQSRPIDPRVATRFRPRRRWRRRQLPGRAGPHGRRSSRRTWPERSRRPGHSVAQASGHPGRCRRPSAGAHEAFLRVIDKLGVPVVTGWNAHELLWNDHPLYVGRPGSIGDRAGNFAVQNADFLLVLGSRLNVRQVSYNWEAFARAAYIVMIDIDQAELSKPTLSVDLPIHADLADALDHAGAIGTTSRARRTRRVPGVVPGAKIRYPVVLPSTGRRTNQSILMCFVQALFDELDEGDMVVTGDGTACVVTFQAAKLKRGQRLYTNSGCASMGYDLPAAVGATSASGRAGHLPGR